MGDELPLGVGGPLELASRAGASTRRQFLRGAAATAAWPETRLRLPPQ
jgi:hypothetical protein